MLQKVTKNYKFGTYGVFKACKVPQRTPDHVSPSGSKYWFGANKRGDYMIRYSDHWSRIFVRRGKYNKRIKTIRKIAKSIWLLSDGSQCGKIHICNLKTIY